MRSDRKREKLLKKMYKKESKIKNVSRVLSIIYTLAAACFIALLVWLNVVPAKYLYPIIAVILVVSLFIAPVMFSRKGKPGRRKGAMAAAGVMKTWAVLAYLPYLVLAGIIAGLFTGVAAQVLMNRLERLKQ